MIKPDIIAKIYFYTTEEGGREGATPSNYIGFPFEYKEKYYDCRLLLDDIGSIYPGDTVTVPIIFLYTENIVPQLHVGAKFRLWEGGFKAEGKVLEITTKYYHDKSNIDAKG